MGMWIIDGCDLEALARTCRELGRWEFMFFAAPLRLKNSTGSPMNPVAIF
jgi:kynurenine formamidase